MNSENKPIKYAFKSYFIGLFQLKYVGFRLCQKSCILNNDMKMGGMLKK